MKTKADEIDHLNEFVSTLKDCPYLKDYFADFSAEIERAILDDFCAPSFSDSMNRKMILQDELRVMEKKKYDLGQELQVLDYSVKSLKNQKENMIKEVKEIAQRILRVF